MAVQISGNDITVPRDGSFTRNVTIGGTLTYEDVTNIDSVGLVTARTGIEIGARPGVAASISVDGNMIVSGISTFGGDIKTSASNIVLGDSGSVSDDRIVFGAGSDLSIYHNGTHSFLKNDNGTLVLSSDAFSITNNAGNSNRVSSHSGGEVKLYYSDSAKLETTNTGVTVTGVTVDDGATHDGDVTFTSANGNNILFDKSDNSLEFGDSVKAKFGAGGDLNIEHDGSNSYISDGGTGDLVISGSVVRLKSSNTAEDMVKATENAGVEFYYDGTKAAETSSSGFAISGDKTLFIGSAGDFRIGHDGTDNFLNSDGSQSIRIQMGGANHWEFASALFKGNDGKKIVLGDSSDFQFFHDSTYNYIDCVNGKQLRIVNDTQGGNELMIAASPNGAVDLYNNGVKQINTHPNGIFTRGIYPMADNSFSIGAGSQRFHTIYATQGSINTSDRTEKNTIIESDLGLDFVNKLKPVSYKWNEDDGKTHYGLIAQEVEETLIDIGKTVSDFGAVSKEDDSPMGLSYSELISPLIKAVQELSAENTALKARLDAAGL